MPFHITDTGACTQYYTMMVVGSVWALVNIQSATSFIKLRETAYVVGLRDVLVKRLKEEEEYERLTMYARDDRFARDVIMS
jgi:hypothetical protein